MDQIVNDFKLDATIHENYTVHQTGHKRERWYRERKLGEGGFGVVWLEREAATNSCRAVKIVPSSYGPDFRRELLALEKFSRPRFRQYFVQFYGWYDHPGHGRPSIFLVMEYFSHGDLRSFIAKRGALWESDAMIVAKDVAGGLQMLHEEGFTHRDLKLENIFVASDSPRLIIKIGDFGLAKQIPGDHTALRSSVGTPAYSAPEQINEQRQTDEYTNAVDMWCLGHVLFELLTGNRVFTNQNELKMFCEHKKEFPRHCLEAIAVSSFGIDTIVRLMARDPSKRPPASECQDLLHRYLSSAPSVSASSRPQHYVPIAPSVSPLNRLQQYVTSVASWFPSSQEDLNKEREREEAIQKGREREKALQKEREREVAMQKERKREEALQKAVQKETEREREEAMQKERQRKEALQKERERQQAMQKASERREALQLLEVNGYNLSSNDSKTQALLWAASKGNEAAVRVLLENGANANATGQFGTTPLHKAVLRGGHKGIVKLLLEYGANVEATDWTGRTALRNAALEGSKDVVRLLREKGADKTKLPCSCPTCDMIFLSIEQLRGHVMERHHNTFLYFLPFRFFLYILYIRSFFIKLI